MYNEDTENPVRAASGRREIIPSQLREEECFKKGKWYKFPEVAQSTGFPLDGSRPELLNFARGKYLGVLCIDGYQFAFTFEGKPIDDPRNISIPVSGDILGDYERAVTCRFQIRLFESDRSTFFPDPDQDPD